MYWTRIPAPALALLLAACGGGSTATAPQPATPAPAPQPAAPAATAPAPAAPAFRLPGDVAPTRYALDLAIDANQTTLTGQIEIDVAVARPTSVIWLNGAELDVSEATVEVGGETLRAELAGAESKDFVGLVVPRELPAGPARVRVVYTANVSDTEVSGAFRQKEGDDWYVFTQFESISARNAFPCFDEPAFKVPWQLTITVPAGQVAFANTPEVSVADAAGGARTHTFAESKPLPSYLVAFAVGPFDVVDAGTAGRNATPLRIIVPRGKQDQARYAAANMGALLDILEGYFDMPYPYAKLDSIAVPSFFGAMEHPGLITYAQRILLSPPADETDRFHRVFAGVAAHELAHQWFGNLVTMKWWDDLWLNESFATWMATKVTRTWKPEWDDTAYEVGEREQAMEADSVLSAKPVRTPVRSNAELWGGGSAIFYAKGAAVIGMFERWIGEDAFRAGMRSYMRAHAWGNAEAADFFAALAAQSSPELAAAFATFVDQPGVPLLRAKLACGKGGPPAVELSQARYVPAGAELEDEPPLWHVPVCVRYGAGKKAERHCQLVTAREARIELPAARTCPTWYVANEAGAGYYRVAYDGDMLDRLLLGKRGAALDPAERAIALRDMSALVDAGLMPASDAFALVPRLLAGKDRSPIVVMSTMEIVKSVDAFLVPDALRPNYARFIRKLYGKQARALGWAPARGEDPMTGYLRGELVALVAVQGQDTRLGVEATELATRWLDSGDGVHKDMVSSVLAIAAHYGDRALFDRMVAAAKATDDAKRRRELFSAMASFSDPDIVRAYLGMLLSGEIDFREAGRDLRRPLANPAVRGVVFEFIRDNWDTFSARLPSFYRSYIVYISAAFCDADHRQAAEAFWTDKMKDTPGGPNAVSKTLEQIDSCIALRTTQQPSVEAFLKKY